LKTLFDQAELGGDPGGDEGNTGNGGGGGVDQISKELAGDTEGVGEGAAYAAKEDGICDSIEKAKEAEPVDAEKEFLLWIAGFSGEHAIEDRGEAATFLEQSSEGAEHEGENDRAEIPVALENGEVVIFEEIANGWDGPGSGEEKRAGQNGGEERESRTTRYQYEDQRNKYGKERSEISHLGEIANFRGDAERDL